MDEKIFKTHYNKNSRVLNEATVQIRFLGSSSTAPSTDFLALPLQSQKNESVIGMLTGQAIVNTLANVFVPVDRCVPQGSLIILVTFPVLGIGAVPADAKSPLSATYFFQGLPIERLQGGRGGK